MSLRHDDSASFAQTRPALSVLIPFYRDDAEALLKALNRQARDRHVEILLHDDGTGDDTLSDRLRAVVASCESAVRLVTDACNRGRSAARNALCAASRSSWVLFLDADMLPASDSFLSDYLSLIHTANADIIFGGFEVEPVAIDRDRDLHRALSAVSDCLPLAERQAAGPQYVASSNLCVRKSVLDAAPFDSGFSGWGWEDSEWAARVSTRFTLLHADIPAIHLGLETTDTLLKRFANSGANYRRFTQAHPELAQTLALYRISQKLRRVPGQQIMRPLLRLVVKAQALPVRARLSALKLWRASHYAEALS